jgi:hypothetical protein
MYYYYNIFLVKWSTIVCPKRCPEFREVVFHNRGINFLGHLLNIFFKIPEYIMFSISHHYGRHVTTKYIHYQSIKVTPPKREGGRRKSDDV